MEAMSWYLALFTDDNPCAEAKFQRIGAVYDLSTVRHPFKHFVHDPSDLFLCIQKSRGFDSLCPLQLAHRLDLQAVHNGQKRLFRHKVIHCFQRVLVVCYCVCSPIYSDLYGLFLWA
jgi:hypothetical protein